MTASVTVMPLGAFHIAHLEPMTGVGMIVCPKPSNDMWLGGSLNGSDWDSAVRALYFQGWEPSTHSGGVLMEAGQTADGLPVIVLVALDPIIGDPEPPEHVSAYYAVSRSVGLA